MDNSLLLTFWATLYIHVRPWIKSRSALFDVQLEVCSRI